MRHCTPSISSITKGSAPVSHSTSPPQTIQDTVRSSRRTSRDAGNAVRSTCTLRRMTTRLVRMGTARRNRPTGSKSFKPQRAITPASSAANGKNTPSYSRAPNQMLRAVSRRPRFISHTRP